MRFITLQTLLPNYAKLTTDPRGIRKRECVCGRGGVRGGRKRERESCLKWSLYARRGQPRERLANKSIRESDGLGRSQRQLFSHNTSPSLSMVGADGRRCAPVARKMGISSSFCAKATWKNLCCNHEHNISVRPS